MSTRECKMPETPPDEVLEVMEKLVGANNARVLYHDIFCALWAQESRRSPPPRDNGP